jgi:hypothetical protein
MGQLTWTLPNNFPHFPSLSWLQLYVPGMQ